MEPEVVKVERRGRKRKRKDVQSAPVDRNSRKKTVETRSKVLVGRYVKKEFEENGVFLGKIVSYDSGLYRVDYEDGDCEDLESGEVKVLLVGDHEMDDEFCRKKKSLDEFLLKKYAKDEAVGATSVANKAAIRVETVTSGVVGNAVESANPADKVESSSHGGVSEFNGAQDEVDGEASTDMSDYEQFGDLEEVAPLPFPPPQLPPSSGNIGVSEEHVPYLLSVYSFLRSFSVCLFLSPFKLDEFVGALNCSVHNTLFDAIHVALLRTLKSHVEVLSSEGSERASKCLRSINWSLLDSLTWPAFIVQYLMTMRYTEGPEWKEFYAEVLEKDYYTLSSGRKLIILQILCDDALDSVELTAEVDMREESEGGPDPDGILVSTDESVPTRVHSRYSRTSSFNDQEAVKNISQRCMATLPPSTISLGSKSIGSYTAAGVHVDEDGNVDECRLCGMDGTLLCCDGCPLAYHSRCIGVSKMFIPQGAWYCPECTINKIDPKVTTSTNLRGATFFGIDPYEQVFFGSCDHLLVMKASENLEQCFRYYARTDIWKVLRALNSTSEYRIIYSGISKGILQHWEIPEDRSFLTESVGSDKMLLNKFVAGEHPTPCILSEGSSAPEGFDSENVLNSASVINSKDIIASCPKQSCTERGFDHTSLDKMREFHRIDPQMVEHGSHNGDSAGVKPENTWSASSVGLQPLPSELNHQCLGGKLSIKETPTCASGNGRSSNRSHVIAAGDVSNKFPRSKGVNKPSGGRGFASSADACFYMGSSFKPQVYLNVYTQGDFAYSAATYFSILSSEENRVSQPQTSSNHRKMVSANYSLQLKAFSLAAKRFYWPNYERKLVEVPRERCGWCLSCKANNSSKRGCLLNAAASTAIKGTAKILTSLCPSKHVEGSLASIATYVMFMEQSLCGLTVGPFASPTYRKQWHKHLEDAATLSAIKASLLELERSSRSIAFSADWTKLVDDMGLENPVTQSTSSVVVSTQKRGPGRRGRKPSTTSEVTDASGEKVSTEFAWWRGGMLSKHVLHKGILPHPMLKKSARQGGSEKIYGVHYVEGFEVPKRSRQFLWRAAVQISETASQLALQVRHLDHHVRWNDLVHPEQPSQDGKGSDSEASAFRNACIVDKKVVENKISYGVVFENQKHLPSRVLKNILEVEANGQGKEKYWFIESRIPLYLIKEYEEKVEEVILPSADEHLHNLLQRKKSKARGKNIFTFLSHKRDNLGKCFCTLCQLDISYRNAARCSACEGYFHEHCTITSPIHMNGQTDFLITCKQCHEKAVAARNENTGDSPTSPLLLQGQDTVAKDGRQDGYGRVLESLNQSSGRKATKGGKQSGKKAGTSEKKLVSNRPTASKGGKQNGCNDESAGKKPTKSRSTLGLIWKKKNVENKNPENTGIDFRLNNILFKGNPNKQFNGPSCIICSKPYNPDLMYIRCQKCDNWYHAESVELDETEILNLVGFKCCRCRRIRSPMCPYMDPEEKRKWEAKKFPSKFQKQTNFGTDSNSEINDELVNDFELDAATPILDTSEIAIVQEDENPNLVSHPMVDQVKEENIVETFECPAVSVPQKLPVRRHIKTEKEKESDCSSANNLALEPNGVESASNPAEQTSTPIVEWDASVNGFDDNMMLDIEGLGYEDMEFEPQTYFSFKELLAPDDDVGPDGGDPSGDAATNWNNPPAALPEDYNPEQYQMDISYDEQEPMFSVETSTDIVPCRMCSQADPSPDLYCQICGLWIHRGCSPWEEQTSWEGGNWFCGHCREWL